MSESQIYIEYDDETGLFKIPRVNGKKLHKCYVAHLKYYYGNGEWGPLINTILFSKHSNDKLYWKKEGKTYKIPLFKRSNELYIRPGGIFDFIFNEYQIVFVSGKH